MRPSSSGLPPLPELVALKLKEAIFVLPSRREAQRLLEEVSVLGALPLEGKTSLGFARCLLRSGQLEESVIWGDIATGRLGEEGQLFLALMAQLSKADGQVRLARLFEAGATLRDVGAATAHLVIGEAALNVGDKEVNDLQGQYALVAGNLALAQGQVKRGLSLLNKALSCLCEDHDVMVIQTSIGSAYLMNGDVREAVVHFEKGAEFARAWGGGEEELEALMAVVVGLVALGEVDAAKKIGRRGLKLAKSLHLRGAELAFGVQLAEASQSLEDAAHAMEMAAQLGEAWIYTQMVLLLAHLQRQGGHEMNALDVLLTGTLALLSQGRSDLAEILRGTILAQGEESPNLDLSDALRRLGKRVGGRT